MTNPAPEETEVGQGSTSVATASANPNPPSRQAPALERPAAVAAAHKAVKAMLETTDPLITKAEAGDDLIEFKNHDTFKESKLNAIVEGSAGDLELLASTEAELLIQIERLEAVERALERSSGQVESLIGHCRETSERQDAYFDHLMTRVKLADRPTETQVRAFQAFLAEAQFTSEQLRDLIYVLPLDGEALLNNPNFGQGDTFGPIQELRRVHENVYGMWVTDVELFGSFKSVQQIGRKALAHTAVAIVNTKHDMLDPRFRRDEKGALARVREGREEVADPTPAEIARVRKMKSSVDEADLQDYQQLVSDAEGLERVVICFDPIRARLASRYEAEQGDVVIPSSYAYGGKMAFVALESGTSSIATSIARSGVGAYRIGAYAHFGDQPNDNGTSLYDHEGTALPEGMVFIVGTTGSGTAAEQGMTIDGFHGQYTARGKPYQAPLVFAYDYLRRLMMVLARGRVGAPITQEPQIRQEIQTMLQKNLVGDSDTKPFTAITVQSDSTSDEAAAVRREQGIRLIVHAEGKAAISDIFVEIRPDGKGNAGEQ